jgi:hypothetical protein
MITCHACQACSYSPLHASILNHMITLKENNNRIYYLTDVVYSFDCMTLIVFHLRSSLHLYDIHHILLRMDDTDVNRHTLTEYIDCQHCCCFDNEMKPVRTRLISGSQCLSLIHMSCDIEYDEEINENPSLSYLFNDAEWKAIFVYIDDNRIIDRYLIFANICY